MLAIVLYLSLYIRSTIISFVYSFIILWISLVVNMGRRKIAFLLPSMCSAMISFVACLFDILISINAISGPVHAILFFGL